MICAYTQRFTQDKDNAQEIAQKVFIKFWKKRKKITISISAKANLHQMAYNEYLMYQRQNKKEITQLDRLTYESLREYETISVEEIKQKSEKLKKSIEKLPTACQEVLNLKMGRATYKEIALEMNMDHSQKLCVN